MTEATITRGFAPIHFEVDIYVQCSVPCKLNPAIITYILRLEVEKLEMRKRGKHK